MATSEPGPDDIDLLSRLGQLLDAFPHLVGITDAHGAVVWLNGAGRAFIGVGPDEPVQTSDVFTDAAFERYYTHVRPEVLAGRPWHGTLEVRRARGGVATVDAFVVGSPGPGGEVQWLAMLAIDVTEQRAREAELAHRASHDTLTGLPNRALAEDRLRVAMAVAERSGTPVAAIALDLDGFKDINDRLGHAAGDVVLQQVTARLTAAVRPADTVARFGGDEFVVVIHPPESTQAAVLVAQRIRDQIASPAYVVEDEEIHLSASIGLTVAEPLDRFGMAALLRAADRGMYRAKRAGGNCIRVTSASDSGELDELDRLGHDLASALSLGQIAALFEPVVAIDTGEVQALRVHARWDHPTRGSLRDDDFFQEAEVTGYRDLVWWAATRSAIRAASTARVPCPLDLPLPVSVLCSDDVVARFERLRTSAPDVHLRLVISERNLVEIPGTVIELVEAFATLGVGSVLADHGTGGAPLVLLAELPIEAVELEPGLTKDARARPDVVATAAQLATNHGVPCVAAEVTRPADREVLGVLGVDAVRGPVTGAAWDEAHLASEANGQLPERQVTRPRP